MRVSVTAEPSFTRGSPEFLFEGNYAPGQNYDINPDGQRFLMLKPVGAEDGSAQDRLHVVQNWFTELERLVPTP